MLLLLGVFFSLMTLTEQQPTGEIGGQQVANAILAQHSSEASIWVVTRDLPSDQAFAKTLTQSLVAAGYDRIHPVVGPPRDARAALIQWQDQGAKIDAIAGTEVTSTWLVFADLETSFPEVGSPRIHRPTPIAGPTFSSGTIAQHYQPDCRHCHHRHRDDDRHHFRGIDLCRESDRFFGGPGLPANPRSGRGPGCHGHRDDLGLSGRSLGLGSHRGHHRWPDHFLWRASFHRDPWHDAHGQRSCLPALWR